MKKSLIVLMIIAVLIAAMVGCKAAPNRVTDDGYQASDRNIGGEGTKTPEDAEMPQPPTNANADFGLKIIYTASLDIETLDYAASYAAIINALEQAGGYVSATNQRGGTSASGAYVTKSAYLEVRVPVKQYDDFLNGSGDFGNVTSRDESSEDITGVYVDTQARLDALKTQEQRLLELLAKAGSLQDLILLEDRLSQVRAEIESLTTQMKIYDNRVEYCTIYIYLQEVNQITPQNQNFWKKLGNTVISSLKMVVVFLYWLLIAIIYLLPFAALGAIGFFITRWFVRRSKARNQAKRLDIKTPEGNNGG